MSGIKGFMGTYTPTKGVYSFLYDVQKDVFVKTGLFYPVKDAKYLSYYRNRLAFPTQFVDTRLCVLADGRELLVELKNSTACYAAQDEDCIYTVNCHSGTLIRHRFSEEGLHEEDVVHVQHEADAYQAVLTGTTILVSYRLLDRVRIYKRTSMRLVRAISFLKGTDIQYGVLDDRGKFLYAVNKDSCEVFEMNMEQGGVATGRFSLLGRGEQSGGAAIRVSSNSETLYVSVCGIDQLYVTDIAQWHVLQCISSDGDHPCDINLSPQGDYLFAADHSSGSLVASKIDHINGMLGGEAYTDTIPEGANIIFYERGETRTRANNTGMMGLTVMGRSFALSMADHGYKVGDYNRNYTVTERISKVWPHKNFTGYSTPEELIASPGKSRKVMLMVRAGKAVDAIIGQLVPLLEQGDIILNGGNSFFEDAIQREAYLKGKGLHYFGVGISGGEDDARFGPNTMPGGNRAVYEEVRPILEAVAAWTGDGAPCYTYIGENGAEHYVKVVHSDVEYADIQLIVKAYLLLKCVGHFDNAQPAEIFSEYQKGELNSFLIHITPDIFHEQDDKSGEELIDRIRSAAQQKGTGCRTSIEALKRGVDASIIIAAGNTRVVSNNESRRTAERRYPHVEVAEIPNPDAFKEKVHQGLYTAKVVACVQDFNLLKQANASYNWEPPLGRIASIFRADCIIQAKFLNDITRAYKRQTGLLHLLLDSFSQEYVISYGKNLWQIGAQAALSGTPIPTIANAISYLDLPCVTRIGVNLIQAQRDYFGVYTFERVDKEGGFHHEWRRWA